MKPLSRAALIHVKTEQLARIQRITVVTHVAVLHVSPDLTAKLLSRAAPVHVKTEVLARIPPISALTPVMMLDRLQPNKRLLNRSQRWRPRLSI